jgi:hypothetical protein
MQKMGLTIGIAAMLMSCGAQEEAKTEEPVTAEVAAATADSGWISLFDGSTTKGWHAYLTDTVGKAWKVENGELRLDASQKNKGRIIGGGSIVSNESYENFHLQLEWKISKNGNSGIMFLVNEDSKYKEPYHTGPEFQVLDNDGHPDAKINKHRAGDLYDLISSSPESVKPVGEWNLAEIILNQGKLELKLNGSTVVSTTMWDDNWKALVAGSKFKQWPDFATYKSGKICLQDHDDDVWYRKIRIRKL